MIFLFLIPLIFAAVTTVNVGDEGFDISYPLENVLRINQDYNFVFHINNKSNGYPLTEGIGCIFHIYNSLGVHQYEAFNDTSSSDLDFEFFITGTNFSDTGQYSYLLTCNNSVQGGFVASAFDVTPNGSNPTTAASIFYIGLLFLLIIFFIISIYASFKIESLLVRFILLNVAYLLLIALTFSAYTMADNFLTSVSFITAFLKITWRFIFYAYFPYILALSVWIIYMMLTIKQINNLMEKGVPYDEALERTTKKKRR